MTDNFDGNIMSNPEEFRRRQGNALKIVTPPDPNADIRFAAVEAAGKLNLVTTEQMLEAAKKIERYLLSGLLPDEQAPVLTSGDAPGGSLPARPGEDTP